MRQHFTIKGRFCSLNEFYRMHYQKQGKVKRDSDAVVTWSAKQARIRPFDKPVEINCVWVEENRKRDLDNIMFGIKFVLDGLVKAGVLKDDSPRYVKRITHEVAYDSDNPRIEVWING